MNSLLTIGIVIPTLQEEQTIADCLTYLERQSPPFEVIVVDGGSTDQTLAIAAATEISYPLRLERSPQPGRAYQMNWGSQHTEADILLFLHADSRLPPEGLQTIRTVMTDTTFVGGRFKVKLDSAQWPYPLISWGINTRSQITGYFTGDMGLFIRRSYFNYLEGYRHYSLMEDLDLSGRMKAIGRLAFLPDPMITSSRRFQTYGPWRTIGLMQVLRVAYRLGVHPEVLARWYRLGR